MNSQHIQELADALRELEERLIPTGLHVLEHSGDLTDAIILAAEHHPSQTITQLQADLQRPSELDALVNALAGRYVPPSSGGDLIRNPQSIPTGRNLHGLNPTLVPTIYALKQAVRTVDLLLERLGDTPFLADPGPWIEGTRFDQVG